MSPKRSWCHILSETAALVSAFVSLWMSQWCIGGLKQRGSRVLQHNNMTKILHNVYFGSSQQHFQDTALIISLHVEEEKWHQQLEMRSCKMQICTNRMKMLTHRIMKTMLSSSHFQFDSNPSKYFDHLARGYVHCNWKKCARLMFKNENFHPYYKVVFKKKRRSSSPLLWNDQRSTFTQNKTHKHTLTALSMLV